MTQAQGEDYRALSKQMGKLLGKRGLFFMGDSNKKKESDAQGNRKV